MFNTLADGQDIWENIVGGDKALESIFGIRYKTDSRFSLLGSSEIYGEILGLVRDGGMCREENKKKFAQRWVETLTAENTKGEGCLRDAYSISVNYALTLSNKFILTLLLQILHFEMDF